MLEIRLRNNLCGLCLNRFSLNRFSLNGLCLNRLKDWFRLELRLCLDRLVKSGLGLLSIGLAAGLASGLTCTGLGTAEAACLNAEGLS